MGKIITGFICVCLFTSTVIAGTIPEHMQPGWSGNNEVPEHMQKDWTPHQTKKTKEPQAVQPENSKKTVEKSEKTFWFFHCRNGVVHKLALDEDIYWDTHDLCYICSDKQIPHFEQIIPDYVLGNQLFVYPLSPRGAGWPVNEFEALGTDIEIEYPQDDEAAMDSDIAMGGLTESYTIMDSDQDLTREEKIRLLFNNPTFRINDYEHGQKFHDCCDYNPHFHHGKSNLMPQNYCPYNHYSQMNRYVPFGNGTSIYGNTYEYEQECGERKRLSPLEKARQHRIMLIDRRKNPRLFRPSFLREQFGETGASRMLDKLRNNRLHRHRD